MPAIVAAKYATLHDTLVPAEHATHNAADVSAKHAAVMPTFNSTYNTTDKPAVHASIFAAELAAVCSAIVATNNSAV